MRQWIAIIVAALALLAACSEPAPERVAPADPSIPPPSHSPSPTAPRSPAPTPSMPPPADLPKAPPVASAKRVRDALLDVAAGSVGEDPGAHEDFGVIGAWREAYPRLEFTGFALKASRRSVPVYAGPADPASPASPANPYLIAFSVFDRKGRCAGGVLDGFPVPEEPRSVALERPTACTAADSAASAGYDVR